MIAKQHQTIIDLAIQSTGSAEAAFELALMNGYSITDDVETGHVLSVPDVVDVDVLNYFTQKGIQPATAWLDNAERVVSAADVVISDENLLTSNYITVLDGQTLFDIAMQQCGSAEAAFDLAIANDISITDILTAGTKLIPVAAISNKIVSYYEQKGIRPATSITEATVKGIFDFTFDFSFE